MKEGLLGQTPLASERIDREWGKATEDEEAEEATD